MSAAEVDMTPVGGGGWDQNAWGPDLDGRSWTCMFNHAGPGYFHTMGTPLSPGAISTSAMT